MEEESMILKPKYVNSLFGHQLQIQSANVS